MNNEQRSSLTTQQWAILVTIGATLWFGAAMLIQAIEPLGGLRLPGVIITYVLLVPGTVPFVLLARRLAGLWREETSLGVTVATATAGLLDGIALALFPSSYGADPAGAGAVILWGAGVALALGLAMSAAIRDERGHRRGRDS